MTRLLGDATTIRQSGNRYLPLVLSVLLFVAFASLAINHAIYFTMDGDEAFNASIAKNWVAGYGYSSSLGVIFPFDAYISSGPAYTLLQALPIYFFGNDPDIQKPFITIVHLLLFGNILLLLQKIIQDDSRFFSFVAFTLSSFLLIEFRFWHRPAGELLSLLYFLNGALLLSNAIEQKKCSLFLMAGLFVALSALTKNQAALWMIGIFIPLIFTCIQKPSRQNFLFLAAFFITSFIPVFSWEFYKHGVMSQLAISDPDLYQYGLGKDWHFFSTHGSGMYLSWEIETWQDLFRRLSSTPKLAFTKFNELFGAYGIFSAAYTAALPLFTIWILANSYKKNKSTYWLFLSLPLALFLIWAFFLNNSVYSHQMLPAAWYWIVLSAFWLSRYPLCLYLLITINVTVLSQHAIQNNNDSCLLSRDAVCIHHQVNPIRLALNDTLVFMQTHDIPQPIANCGWYFAQDIEFSLPGINHIQDCMRLFDSSVAFDTNAFITKNKLPESFRKSRSTEDLIKIYVNKRKNLFGADFVAPVQWKKPLEFTYVANAYMVGSSLEQKRNVISFLDHCKNVLYKNQFYAIQHCSYADLQDYVNEWGGLPIFTHHWEALYYADFMYTTKTLRKNPVHMRPY